MSESSSNAGYTKFNNDYAANYGRTEEVKGSGVILQQPGYAAPQQPAYPMVPQPGYPAAQQPGYPMAQQPGYPIVQQPGYPAAQQPGYPAAQQPAYPPGYQPPAVVQNWMPMPATIPNCPPGLEYLTTIDQLLVHQQIDLLEALSGFEVENKYMVKNSMGQDIYTAQERSDMCGRQCCGANRAFDMHISDNFGREVIHLKRPLNCCGCCFPCCCLQTMEICSPPGTVVGSIKEEWSIFKHKYNLLDEAGNVCFSIEKGCCFCECCSDIKFQVLSPSGEQVGNVTKQFGGFAREMVTNADNFSVTFPMNLDVKMKAVMLGACIFIDFKHFENRNTQRK